MQNTQACEQLLKHSGALIDKELVPGCRDISANFVDAKEIFGEKFAPPCSPVQESFLKKNRNLFTAGEDNLVLRGVNLYGEKQWILIADRFLPERSVNIISQRYAKLCFLLYKAHGIKIDKAGNLEDPPKLESVDDLDEEQVAKLHRVPPPAILNVHRWSIEEDLTLLKAVAVMGSMWAELRARLIPHRDRGHLRKRYQVLERRMKATAVRVTKHEKILEAKLRTPTRPPFVFPKIPQPTALLFSPAVYSPKVGLSLPKKRSTHRTVFPVSKTAVVKRSSTGAHQSGRALPPSAVRKTGSKSPNKTTKPVADRQGSAYSESVNQTAPILAHALPYHNTHHPAYLYQPPPGYHPHMAYPYYYYPPGYGDDGSWAAYEQLAHDPSYEWSHMSQVRKMLENETEVASTIVTQLAKSPSKPPSTSQIEETSTVQESSRPVRSMMPPTRAAAKSAKSASRSLAFASGPTSSPSRGKAPPSQSTPARYTSPGTPMTLPSPAMPSALMAHDGSPSTTAGIYPAGSSPFVYHHAEFSHIGHSLTGYDLNGVFSNAASEGNKDEAETFSPAKSPEPSLLFAEGELLLDTDLEAVSALHLLKSPSKSHVREGVAFKVKSGRKSAERKSLFAKVVGSVKDKEKSGRKRKKFNR